MIAVTWGHLAVASFAILLVVFGLLAVGDLVFSIRRRVVVSAATLALVGTIIVGWIDGVISGVIAGFLAFGLTLSAIYKVSLLRR
jgi:hypothetical protein